MRNLALLDSLPKPLGLVQTGRTHSYWIVPATRDHVYAMADLLRRADMEELAAAGLSAKRALWRGFRRSLWPKTAFIDGRIAAMWGLDTTAIGDHGAPWLLTTDTIELMPLAFIKEAKEEVRMMLQKCRVLENHVLASYTQAVRLVQILGFTVDPPQPTGKNGALFRRFRMER
jgi:hypothetical protein